MPHMTNSLTLFELKSRLAACARAHGASAFGVSTAAKSAQTATRLTHAVERGDLLTWKYDEAWAHAASDPATHVAGAQSVICVAVSYAHRAPPARLGFGKVSSYAWTGGDYHAVLHTLLEALVRELQAFGQTADALVICDTRPLAERAFAVNSGLGWVGKHTNVIAPGIGSYVFLGEIVTSLRLPPDEPRKIHCGSCTRCVKACPTGALRGDYTMDAGKCISDLTQMRGSIPRAMRPFIGTWIWGCDICQAVCPPTRIAGATGHAQFAPPHDAYPDLLSLLTLSKREFELRYRNSSMGWRGPTILRRNAAVALGNTLDRATVPALLAAFDREGSDTVREHIAWALQRIGSPQAIHGIASRLVHEKAPAVRQELQIVRAVATK